MELRLPFGFKNKKKVVEIYAHDKDKELDEKKTPV